MLDPVLRQPALVAAPSDEGADVKLRARRCACGHLFFPPHAYGCERCGRDEGETHSVELEARGVLRALATVHQHPKLPVPFSLGRVALDAGVSIDVVLTRSSQEPTIGLRVRGVLVLAGTNESGAELFDLRFEPEDHRS